MDNEKIDKFKMESIDMTQENIEKIGNLFPNCITETRDENGELKKAVNFEILKQMLSPEILVGDEAYEFTWVGKKASIVEANKPIRKTLRPCPEESVNWDSTENLYIEGDNLEVLKLLQESYLGKIKMIYIDPPYNTGKDFVYPDSFIMGNDEYNGGIGYFDENGDVNYSRENITSAGRYHSDWCSMLYSRLMVSRSLLSEDGVLFISIDNHEVDNLKKMCDEVLGNSNFISIINWKGTGARQDSAYYAAVHQYILCYAKNKNNFVAGEAIKSGDIYPYYDSKLNQWYKKQLLRKWGTNSRRVDRPNLFYPIIAPDGSKVYPMLDNTQCPSEPSLGNEGRWRHGADTMKANIERGKVEFVKQSNDSWIAYEKIFAPTEGEEKTQKYTTWIDYIGGGATVIKNLFGQGVFSYPKPPSLISHFMKMANVTAEDIVMDFFSGSATTAHAVMQLNVEDGGHRNFIMVQLPEITAEKSEAYKAGFKNICEIGKERIRRAGKKIIEEHSEVADSLDIGFRVLKLDESNMNDVYYNPSEYSQDLLSRMESNVKADRTDLDLLFGCLLEWGLPLSLPYSSEKIEGCTVHNYNDGDLIACFDEKVPDSVIKNIARRKPLRAVFRDSSFADSPSKINVGEIFKLLSPDTRVKVI